MKALALAALLALPHASASVIYTHFLPPALNAYIGVPSGTTINAMTTDAAGNLYVTGSTNTTNFPVTAGVVQPALTSGNCPYIFDPHSPTLNYNCVDAFVMKLDTTGNIVWATYLGGAGRDIGQAIAVDSQGSVYVAGQTFQGNGTLNNFPVTPGAAFTSQSSAQFDAFVAKLNSAGTQLIYSTLLPDGAEGGISLAVDASGNAIFGGSTVPSQGAFPTTPGAYQTTSVAPTQAHGLIAKLNATGSALVFSTYLGGNSSDVLESVALDAAGNIYAAGYTHSTTFPTTASAYLSTPPNNENWGFVAKLNPQASALMYSTYIGGNTYDYIYSLGVDAQGNAVIEGTTASSNFPTTPGAFESTTSVVPWWPNYPLDTERNFVARFNSTGAALIYSTIFNGATAVRADSAGDAYVLAQVGYDFPTTTGASQSCMAGGSNDVLVVELSPAGAVTAASYLGGSIVDTPTALALGGDGSVYVGGSTTSSDFPGTPQPVNGTLLSTALPFLTHMAIANSSQINSPCMALVAQNGASFSEGAIAPGELITLRGFGFGPQTGVNNTAAASLPTQLSGVQVLFDGVPAPLLYVQSQQINVQAPWELSANSTTRVQVSYNGALSNAASIKTVPVAPAFFLRDFAGDLEAAALNADGSINSAANPAKAGSLISIWGTGAGPTNPPSVTGAITPLSPLAFATLPVTAQVNNTNAQVQFIGAAPALSSGVFQVNIIIPANAPSGSDPVSISVGGVLSASLRIMVQ
jgi:uncharacterized protein (TIGR03437 family)